MIPVLVAVVLAGLLASCGGGGDGGGGSFAPAAIGQSIAKPDAGPDKGQEVLSNKTAQDAPLCTVEIYGDSIMASNGTAVSPSTILQLFRPNLLVVADHSVAGMSLSTLASTFPALTRSAHYVIVENGVIDAWHGENINKVISDYYAIVQRVRNEGRVPVLTGFSRQALGGELGYSQLLRRDYYDRVIRAIATNTNTPFADWGAVPFYGAWDLVDFTHPGLFYSNRLVAQLALTLDMLATNCTETLFAPS